jgi:predicted RNA-binding Zn ribbon-like protein
MVSSSSRRPFEFVANHIVLDFINTVNARPIFTRDDLGCADDVVTWALAAGLALHPSASTTVDDSHFGAAIDLRERLYRVFGPISHGHSPPEAAIATIVRRAADAQRSATWSRGPSGYEPKWADDPVVSVCDRLGDEALQLLRSPAVHRVGSCDGCGWLFLDVSRAHARRWCSMNMCGVRSKMRRYHQRQATAVDAT